MALVKTASVNLLESATVTLSTGAAATGYPLYRLYDRDIGRMFIGSAATTTVVHIDQGASGAVAVDRLMIPSGHNLASVTLDIEWSTNNSSWTAATTQWTGAAGNIEKTWSSLTKRYWRFTMTSPAAAPELAELWLGPTETWSRNPSHPGGPEEPLHNVAVVVSAEGRPRFEINGVSLRQRNYSLVGIDDTQRTQVLALWSAFAGSKPFWLCDPDGVWIYGRLLGQPQVRTTYDDADGGVHDATINFLEVPV